MSQPPRVNMASAREEAELVLFSTVSEVLKANGTSPQAVDILIVNCSLFNPTPSLSGALGRAGWDRLGDRACWACGQQRPWLSYAPPPAHAALHPPAPRLPPCAPSLPAPACSHDCQPL